MKSSTSTSGQVCKGLELALLLVVLCAPSVIGQFGEEFYSTYAGSTTGGPTWVRPPVATVASGIRSASGRVSSELIDPPLPPTPLPPLPNPYVVIPFSANTNGSYNFRLTGFYGCIFLYGASFNASRPLDNLIIGAGQWTRTCSDSDCWFPMRTWSSSFSVTLTQGERYNIVITGSNGDSGLFVLNIREPSGQNLKLGPMASFSGDYTGGPKWIRPLPNGNNPPIAVYTGPYSYPDPIPYRVITFSVNATGIYSFLTPSSEHCLFLYGDSFDPSRPLENVIIGNDDFNVEERRDRRPGLAATLTQGARYNIVVTHTHGYWNWSSDKIFAFYLQIWGPGVVAEHNPSPTPTLAPYSVIISGTTIGGPTWNRPIPNGNNPPTTTATDFVGYFPYTVIPFSANSTGLYTFLSSGFDTCLFLYDVPFNSSRPLANVIVGNDDITPVDVRSGFSVTLNRGARYNIVITGYFVRGNDFELAIWEPGMAAEVSPSPEPTLGTATSTRTPAPTSISKQTPSTTRRGTRTFTKSPTPTTKRTGALSITESPTPTTKRTAAPTFTRKPTPTPTRTRTQRSTRTRARNTGTATSTRTPVPTSISKQTPSTTRRGARTFTKSPTPTTKRTVARTITELPTPTTKSTAARSFTRKPTPTPTRTRTQRSARTRARRSTKTPTRTSTRTPAQRSTRTPPIRQF